MRLKGGMRPKKFQMGGGAGGTAFTPQQQATLAGFGINPGSTLQAPGGPSPGGPPPGAPGAGGPTDPSGVAAAQNNLAQMFWNRATPQQQQQMTSQGVRDPRGGSPPGGSSLGALPPGAGMPPGGAPPPGPGGMPGGGMMGGIPGGMPPGGMQPRGGMQPGGMPGGGMMGGMPGGMPPGGMQPGGMPPGGMQPRPGMGWGAPPGAGPMGAPPGGGASLAGAGGMPGTPPMPPQQQAMMGALSGRGANAPGMGMPGSAPGAGAPGAPGAPGAMNPAMQQYLASMGGAMGPMGFAEGGSVSTFDSTKAAPGNLPTHSGKAKLAKGGVLRRKPKAVKAKLAAAPQPPPDDDAEAPVGLPAAAPGPPLPGGMPGPPGMKKGGKFAKGGKCVSDTDKDGMKKGGECDKMAAGGAAKQRRKFPNTISPPKKMASGGHVRGAGIAQRGTNFSGIY